MRPKPPHFSLLFLILILAALLRFYNLSGQSLWSDEGNSIALARRGFVEIAQRTAFDIHPPLYYWLLKIWITGFGDSEIGLRSFSVVLGIGLVYVIGLLGTRLFNPRVGLIAAFIAALSPFQVYYSQEARMYMLLTILGSLTVLAMLHFFKHHVVHASRLTFSGLLYALTVTAGLYTHYAYPVMLIVVNVVTLIWFRQHTKYQSRGSAQSPASNLQPFRTVQNKSPLSTLHSPLSNWIILQFIPLLLYLPWLPTAWRQITTWPSEQQPASLTAILNTISTTLFFGLSWPYDLGMSTAVGLGLILVITAFSFFTSRVTPHASRLTRYASGFTLPVNPTSLSFRLALFLLWLWLLFPVILTSFIFSPAFLKFLLVATPALALLPAIAIEQIRAIPKQRWLNNLVGGALLAILTGTSLLSLHHYYTNADYARDNYRSMVQFIRAVGGVQDAVILHAEGQQDVFNYYYERGFASSPAPVYPLPRRRPLDEVQTLAELQKIGDMAHNVYGVYWATRQADPNGLIVGWLDSNLVKATDQWYGNVRLVSYASPLTGAKLVPNPVDYRLGPNIRLTGFALSTARIKPGEILQVVLEWQTNESLAEDYTVFLQVLDQANHVVGQRDAGPLTATSGWSVGQPVIDTHGIFIEPGTPPGKHRLIIGLYSSQTGQRLPVLGREQPVDFVELAKVEVIPPPVPLPLAAFNMQVPMKAPMLNLTLLGYDFYKLGHRSSPDTPLHPGDPVQLVAYWTSRQPAKQPHQQLSIRIVTSYGQATRNSVNYPVAGVDYPVSEWSEGEIIRAQYDFFLSELEPGSYRLGLSVDGQAEVVTNPFRVE
jgi:uncharacterized membrane protein